MSFGGSVSAMIQSIRSNKMLLGHRYTYFDAKQDYLRVAKGLKISSRKATKEEIWAVKEKIRKQKKSERVKITIVLSFIFPLLIYGMHNFLESHPTGIPNHKIEADKEILERYQFYIEDGDYMISKGKWNNAIFQYTRASEIYPNEFDAQYRLALAYTYKCQYTKEDCLIGDSLVNILLIQSPKNAEVKGLKVSLDNAKLKTVL